MLTNLAFGLLRMAKRRIKICWHPHPLAASRSQPYDTAPATRFSNQTQSEAGNQPTNNVPAAGKIAACAPRPGPLPKKEDTGRQSQKEDWPGGGERGKKSRERKRNVYIKLAHQSHGLMHTALPQTNSNPEPRKPNSPASTEF